MNTTQMPDLKNMSAEEQSDLVCGLTAHLNPDLRAFVAGHSDTDPSVVRMLAVDIHPEVRVAVARREDRHTADINYEMRNDRAPAVTAALASNPYTTAPTLEELADRSSNLTRLLVMNNDNTPEEVRDRIKAEGF